MTPAEGIAYLQGLPADEPVFVLRGKDAFAPCTVTTWAALCLGQRSFNMEKDAALQLTRDKGQRAMTLAQEMRAFQETNGSKVPD